LSPITGLPTQIGHAGINGLTSGVVTPTTGSGGGHQSPHSVNGALAAAAAAAAQGCPGTPSPVQSTEPLTAAAVFAATGIHPAAYTCKLKLLRSKDERPGKEST
jgi:hypothetical protein